MKSKYLKAELKTNTEMNRRLTVEGELYEHKATVSTMKIEDAEREDADLDETQALKKAHRGILSAMKQALAEALSKEKKSHAEALSSEKKCHDEALSREKRRMLTSWNQCRQPLPKSKPRKMKSMPTICMGCRKKVLICVSRPQETSSF
jgi:hypothetical protein